MQQLRNVHEAVLCRDQTKKILNSFLLLTYIIVIILLLKEYDVNGLKVLMAVPSVVRICSGLKQEV